VLPKAFLLEDRGEIKGVFGGEYPEGRGG